MRQAEQSLILIVGVGEKNVRKFAGGNSRFWKMKPKRGGWVVFVLFTFPSNPGGD